MTCRMIGIEGVAKGFFDNDYLPNDFSQRIVGIPKRRRNPVSPMSIATNTLIMIETDAKRAGVRLGRREKKDLFRNELKAMEPKMMMHSGYGRGVSM